MHKTELGRAFAFALTLVTGVVLGGSQSVRGAGQTPGAPTAESTPASADDHHAYIAKYCTGCHNARLKSGGLALDGLDVTRIADNAETWEKVVRKLRAGLMPPAGRPRADEPITDALRGWLQDELDRAAAAHPDPGRTET